MGETAMPIGRRERRTTPTPDAASGTIRRAVRALKPGEGYWHIVPITVDQFLKLVDGEGHFELINGVIYRAPDVTIAHETLFGWLFRVSGVYVEERRLGRVFGSRTNMRIDRTSAREPDIAFVSNANLERLTRLEIAGAADFVIEVVESRDARRDAVVKQAQYEQLGVPELWVVDMHLRELRHFRLQEGRYERLPVDPEGEVEVAAIAGFRLTVAWLFQGPAFPSSLDVVNRLLGR